MTDDEKFKGHPALQPDSRMTPEEVQQELGKAAGEHIDRCARLVAYLVEEIHKTQSLDGRVLYALMKSSEAAFRLYQMAADEQVRVEQGLRGEDVDETSVH